MASVNRCEKYLYALTILSRSAAYVLRSRVRTEGVNTTPDGIAGASLVRDPDAGTAVGRAKISPSANAPGCVGDRGPSKELGHLVHCQRLSTVR